MAPALDEEPTIADVVARVPRDLPGIGEVGVLVIDDGSTDATAARAREAGAEVLSHGYNRGLGVAIQSGLAYAVEEGYDLVVNIDADGQFAPEDIGPLLAPVLAGACDVAMASRFKDPALVPEMPWIKRAGNRWMAALISALTGGSYADVSCGFRAYSSEALLRLVLMGGFTYTQETFLYLAFRGLRIQEVPTRVRGVREHGESRMASSIPRYAVQTLRIIAACIRDYRPAMFFNTVAGLVLLPGAGLAAFFFSNYAATGKFTPHLWAGFSAAYLIGTALLLFMFGQLAQMLGRVRLQQDQHLYLLRKLLRRTDRAPPA